MLCKCHWIMLYIVHFTAFSLGGPFFPDTVYLLHFSYCQLDASCHRFNKVLMYVQSAAEAGVNDDCSSTSLLLFRRVSRVYGIDPS